MADPGGSSETRTPVMTPSMFPGFKFSPTDVELITYYLKNKLDGSEKSVEIISEVEISRHEPWDLPGESIMKSDNEWFFFSARGRKYPNGSQSKRATTLGYWKATGKERNVKSGSAVVGTKRTLVFHIGRAPKGERTEWIMHEYCMEGRSQDLVVCRLRKNADFRGPSRQTPPAQGHSSVDDENRTVSEGCMEQTSYSEKEKAFEFCDSHSAENVDSTSENEQNLPNPTTFAGPSTRGKDSDEDCFSDILKDDIIKLDESSFPAPEPLPFVANKYEPVPGVATRYVPERTHWHPVQTTQQTAVVRPWAEPRLVTEEQATQDQPQCAEQKPSERHMRFLGLASEYKSGCFACFLNIAEQMLSLRTMRVWQLPLILFCFSLLVLLVSFLVPGKPFKRSLDLFTSSRTCRDLT